MLMIIGHHFAGPTPISWYAPSITLNRLYCQFIFLGGSMGNDIFVLISGYFLVNSKGINYRRLFNLWCRIFFYSVVIYALFVLTGKTAFDIRTMLNVLKPITQEQWWFASTYFVMYLIHPYINRLLHSFSREDYKKFLATIFIYWSIIPLLTDSAFQANSLITFICLYSFVGYVRLWADDYGSKNFIWLGTGFILVHYVYIVIMDLIGLKIHFFARQAFYMSGMMRPLTLGAALCLLIGFKHIDMKSNRTINAIAAATFGVYLIHSNKFIGAILWKEVFKNASYQDSPHLIPYSIAVILTVYISCTAIELIRSKAFKVLSRGRLS